MGKGKKAMVGIIGFVVILFIFGVMDTPRPANRETRQTAQSSPAQQSAQNRQSQIIVRTQLYQDSRYGFSIEVPQDWILLRRSEQNEVGITLALIMRPPNWDVIATSPSVNIDEQIAKNGSQYYALYKEKIAQKWSKHGGVTYLSDGNKTLGTLQVYEINYKVHFLSLKSDCLNRDVIILAEDKAYIIDFGVCDSPSKFNQGLILVEQIASSFKLLAAPTD
jgi:hypothetical protein